ncbi:hypothetical protein X761_33030 [Mesorhizobium sp. LSHC424B00]|nr:hypothetical protein X761_33030 [Mesorhizobium sp. LSHC424B00]
MAVFVGGRRLGLPEEATATRYWRQATDLHYPRRHLTREDNPITTNQPKEETMAIELTPKMIEDLTYGYTSMVEERMVCGATATLLTFQFNHLSGSTSTVNKKMQETVEKVYSQILTRCFKKPKNIPTIKMPFWICTPDYPVFKRHKDNFRTIVNNDGRHIHVIAVMPPDTRMTQTLDDHFHHEQFRYSGYKPRPLWCLDSQPITHDLSFVVDYGRKGIKTPRVGFDGQFILPRTHSEMESLRADKTEREFLKDLNF